MPSREMSVRRSPTSMDSRIGPILKEFAARWERTFAVPIRAMPICRPVGRKLLARLERTLGFNAEARTLDLVASTRFHRIIRRGREYGAKIPPAEALTAPPDEPESGLQFVCLGA